MNIVVMLDASQVRIAMMMDPLVEHRSMMLIASSIPFVGPMNWMQSVWYVSLVPLAIGIAMIYKAIRVTHLEPTGPGRDAVRPNRMHHRPAGDGLIVFVQFIIPAA